MTEDEVPSQLPDLPPLDPGDDDDTNGALGEREHELFQFDEEGGAEEEPDAPPADWDFGVELSEPTDIEEGTEEAEPTLDLESLLTRVRDEPGEDAEGPTDIDLSLGIVEPAADGDDTDESHDDATLEYAVTENLPALDADEEGFFDEPVVLPLAESMLDEAPPMPSETRWQCEHVDPAECLCVAVGLGVIVAGGTRLLWLAGSALRPDHIPSPAGLITSVATVGQTRQSALLATVTGELWRVRPGSTPSRLESWCFAAGVRAGSATTLRLCQAANDGPHVLLGLTSNGYVVRTADGGDTWQKIELDSAARAINGGGAPSAVLAGAGHSTALHFSNDTGVSFARAPLGHVVEPFGTGDNPVLAAHDEAVALADEAVGLVVSGNQGGDYSRVAGSGRITAVAAGTLDGERRVWAASYLELAASSRILEVDVDGAAPSTIAELTAPAADDDERPDRGRVHALEWDADGRCLWVAAASGLWRLTPKR